MSVNIGKVHKTIPFIQSHREQLGRLFYQILWERQPRLAKAISDTEKGKVSLGFTLLLDNLLYYWHDLQASEEILQRLARTSLGEIFDEGFISAATTVLLEAMRELFGDEWDDGLEAAWDEALGIQRIMFVKALSQPQHPIAAEPTGMPKPVPASE
ncbi:MAG: globin [bacterium]